METEKDNYGKIVELLRRSRPVIRGNEELTGEVIQRLSTGRRGHFPIYTWIESIYGWIYIPWVRRSLVSISVIIAALFIYQQSVLVRQIKNINRQAIVTEGGVPVSHDSVPPLELYRASGLIFSGKDISISETDLRQLIREYINVKGRYTNLVKIIDENPELKKYVEQKLNEKNSYKSEH